MESVKYKVGEVYMRSAYILNIIISTEVHISYYSSDTNGRTAALRNNGMCKRYLNKQWLTKEHTRVSYEEEAV